MAASEEEEEEAPGCEDVEANSEFFQFREGQLCTSAAQRSGDCESTSASWSLLLGGRFWKEENEEFRTHPEPRASPRVRRIIESSDQPHCNVPISRLHTSKLAVQFLEFRSPHNGKFASGS